VNIPGPKNINFTVFYETFDAMRDDRFKNYSSIQFTPVEKY